MHEFRTVAEDAATTSPVLRLEGIHKRFNGLVALDDISLELRKAEVAAIVGDNGAGKSTLLKIVAGLHQPDEGRIWLDGEPVSFSDPRGSRAHGVEVVYQDLALVESQEIFMNMFLGRELRNRVGLLDKRRMKARRNRSSPSWRSTSSPRRCLYATCPVASGRGSRSGARRIGLVSWC